MALTPSVMLPLGAPAPDFSLPDVTTGKNVSLANFSDQPALLAMFICRHCPFVKHIQSELARLGQVLVSLRFYPFWATQFKNIAFSNET